MNDQICTALNINHICLAVRDIEETLRFYQDLFGIGDVDIKNIEDQRVRAALVKVGNTQLEFIQPIDAIGGVARFIERRGEGMHHICFEVDNLENTLKQLDAENIQLIDKTPRVGLSGMIAFIHPKETHGVLIELVDHDTAKR